MPKYQIFEDPNIPTCLLGYEDLKKRIDYVNRTGPALFRIGSFLVHIHEVTTLTNKHTLAKFIEDLGVPHADLLDSLNKNEDLILLFSGSSSSTGRFIFGLINDSKEYVTLVNSIDEQLKQRNGREYSLCRNDSENS